MFVAGCAIPAANPEAEPPAQPVLGPESKGTQVAEPEVDAESVEEPAAPDLSELIERHSSDAANLELTQALLEACFDQGAYEEAWRGLHLGLYVMAQRGELPPLDTWLTYLPRVDKVEHVAEGTRFLSKLREFYSREPEVYLLLIDYVIASGDPDTANQLLTEARHAFPDDERFTPPD